MAFSDLADFLKYNEKARNSPAVQRHSWGGGRIQMWMPYITRTNNQTAENFVHYMTNQTAPKEMWMTSWG